MKVAMLSTIDNPYSPFDDYDSWHAYDVQAGYYTAEFLGRLVHTSYEVSEANFHNNIELIIDEIVKENVLGIYIKVEKEILE